MEKIELPIDMNFIKPQVLFFPAIFTNKNLIPWYYEHFINVFSLNKYKMPHFYYEEETENIFKDLPIDAICINQDFKNMIENIIDLTKEKIKQGYYLYIFLDEYEIEGMSKYNSRRFSHPQLIYGFDNINKNFLSICFDAKNGGVKKNVVTYSNYINAYNSSIELSVGHDFNSKRVAVFFNPNINLEKYIFNKGRFVFRLKQFLSSDSLYERSYIKQFSFFQDNIKYGISIYDHFIAGLKKHIEGHGKFNFIKFHFMYSRAALMVDRFEYINSEYSIGTEYNNLLNEYRISVVDKWSICLNSYIKKGLQQSAFGTMNLMPQNNINFLNDLLSTIRQVKEDEYKILSKIVSVLNSYDCRAEKKPYSLINDYEISYIDNKIILLFSKKVKIDRIVINKNFEGLLKGTLKINNYVNFFSNIINVDKKYIELDFPYEKSDTIEILFDDNNISIADKLNLLKIDIYSANLAKASNIYINNSIAPFFEEYYNFSEDPTETGITDVLWFPEKKGKKIVFEFFKFEEVNIILVEHIPINNKCEYVVKTSKDGVEWLNCNIVEFIQNSQSDQITVAPIITKYLSVEILNITSEQFYINNIKVF